MMSYADFLVRCQRCWRNEKSRIPKDEALENFNERIGYLRRREPRRRPRPKRALMEVLGSGTASVLIVVVKADAFPSSQIAVAASPRIGSKNISLSVGGGTAEEKLNRHCSSVTVLKKVEAAMLVSL